METKQHRFAHQGLRRTSYRSILFGVLLASTQGEAISDEIMGYWVSYDYYLSNLPQSLLIRELKYFQVTISSFM